MPTELWLVHTCDHGKDRPHRFPEPPPGGYLPGDLILERSCEGGSVEVLDPERVLVFEEEEFGLPEYDCHISVGRILDALTEGKN